MAFIKSGWHDSPIAGRVRWQSSYERKFMEFLDKHKFTWRRNTTRFTYTNVFDGKEHKYIPDFIIEDSHGEFYVEVKGGVRANDPAKFEAFPKPLVMLGYAELRRIGLDIMDPLAGKKDRAIREDQWPYKILSQIPDFMQSGELTPELQEKVNPQRFFELCIEKGLKLTD